MTTLRGAALDRELTRIRAHFSERLEAAGFTLSESADDGCRSGRCPVLDSRPHMLWSIVDGHYFVGCELGHRLPKILDSVGMPAHELIQPLHKRHSPELLQRELSEEHAEHLHKSGICDEVIQARGYWTAIKTDIPLLKRMGFKTRMLNEVFAKGDVLVIPQYNVRGEYSYSLLRPDYPRVRGSKS